jgi:hypothetical protein
MPQSILRAVGPGFSKGMRRLPFGHQGTAAVLPASTGAMTLANRRAHPARPRHAPSSDVGQESSGVAGAPAAELVTCAGAGVGLCHNDFDQVV